MLSHRSAVIASLVTWLLMLFGVHPAMAASPLVVDPGSIGGVCSDSRPAAAVTALTPLCSVTKAIQIAPSGSTVYLRGGSYPYLSLNAVGARNDYVTIAPYGYGGPAPESVTIAGVSTSNTSYLRFEGLHLVGNDSSGFLPAARIYIGSQYIQFINNEMTGQGLFLQTANNVLIQGNYIHNLTRNCAVNHIGDGGGIFLIGANSKLLPSNNISVLGNHVEDALLDSLNIGSISGLYVAGNDMSTSPHPLCGDHSDLVQIENGGMGPITINGNVFHDGGEFILRNATGLTIENNLILRVNQWMQLMATPGARVINNTWDGGNALCTGCGSLIIRDYKSGSSFTRAPYFYRNHMQGTVIENNIMRMIANNGVPKAAYHEDYDLIYGPRANNTGLQGRHTVFAPAVYSNAAGGNYTPGPRSAAIDSGDSTVAPSLDMFGHSRWDDPLVPNTGVGPISYVDRGAVEWSPPPSAPPPASAPPAFKLSASVAVTRAAIKRGIFAIRVRCSMRCRVIATGHLSFGRNQHGRARSQHKRSHQRTVGLKRTTTRLAAARSKRIRLRLHHVSRRTLRRLARRYRHGAIMTVRVVAQGPAHKRAVETVRIRVRI